jgi:hypothetical protein
MEGQEKRKTIRIRKPLYVQFGIGIGSAVSWDMSLLKDISEEGLCLRTSMVLEKGQVCYLRFKVPHAKEPMSFAAEVVESLPVSSRVALTRLHFQAVSDDDKRVLREYIALTLANERGGT